MMNNMKLMKRNIIKFAKTIFENTDDEYGSSSNSSDSDEEK